MRRPINLKTLTTLDRLSILIYGPNGCGKTHLQGDFLKWGEAKGATAYVSLGKEEGYRTLAHLDLAAHSEVAETPTDFRAVLADLKRQKVVVAAFDSLTSFRREVMYEVVGERRLPDSSKGGDGERARFFWAQSDELLKAMISEASVAIPWTLWVTPYDRGTDPIAGGEAKFLTPDMPGKAAVNIAGSFDLVGLMVATILGPKRFKRTVDFRPRTDAVTRQRFPRAIAEEIEIPEGPGGWARIFAACEAAMRKAPVGAERTA